MKTVRTQRGGTHTGLRLGSNRKHQLRLLLGFRTHLERRENRWLLDELLSIALSTFGVLFVVLALRLLDA